MTSTPVRATWIYWSNLARLEPYERVDAYFGLLEDLRAILGKQVDLVVSGAVKNRYIARDIERTKQLLYAA